jgi:signal transduction histidine kinase
VRTELEAQAARLEEADQLKGALMATLSHEFRTPLTSIFGYLHLLQRGLGEDERTVHPMRAIKRSAMHLFALAENLLEYARDDAGGSLVQVTRIDLARLGDELRDMFAAIAQEQQLSFSVTAGAGHEAYGDELKLRQILINLISNALRYTPRGGVAVPAHLRRAQGSEPACTTPAVGIASEHHKGRVRGRSTAPCRAAARAPGSGSRSHAASPSRWAAR